MILTANEILQEKLLLLDNTYGAPAQVGYDLSLKSVRKIYGGGKVLKTKTILGRYVEEPLTQRMNGEETFIGWKLYPGVYDVEFHEGCDIPANRMARIAQRSSLLRNGALIASSLFDPGFKTDNIGTVMWVHAPDGIFIEQNARIAQIYFEQCSDVHEDALYNGQWQNDKQRK